MSSSSSSEFLPEHTHQTSQSPSTSSTSSHSDPNLHPSLPISQVGAINRKAQLDGTLIGIPTGIILYLASSRFNLKGQTRTLSSLIGGSATAYIYSRVALHRDLTALEKSIQLLNEQKKAKFDASNADRLDLKSAQETRFEAGVGGLHGFEDRYSTTRGDH